MSGLLKSTFLALFISIISIFAVSFAHAQSIPGIQQPVTFIVAPEVPRPNSSVTVTAQSFITDLNAATLSWSVNGKLFQKGNGLLNITVPVGTVPVKISVSAATKDIGVISTSVSVHPGSVDLVWQSDGYVPPFYEGKAMEAYGATFKVTAIAQITDAKGKIINPKTLIYTWSKNNTIDQDQSGYGKDSYTGTQSSYVRGEDDISVQVSDAANDSGAYDAISISPTMPEVLLYNDSPLYGLEYEHVLGNPFNLTVEEITMRAEPFNISTVSPLSGLVTYDWTLNGVSVPSFRNKNEITLRSAGSSGGQSNIGLTVQQMNFVLQGGQASISILQ